MQECVVVYGVEVYFQIVLFMGGFQKIMFCCDFMDMGFSQVVYREKYMLQDFLWQFLQEKGLVFIWVDIGSDVIVFIDEVLVYIMFCSEVINFYFIGYFF